MVYFEFDRTEINAGDVRKLDEYADFLAANDEWEIVVEGHTDHAGSRAYNMELGARRAAVVRDRMVSRGIAPDRVETVSYGEGRPAAAGEDESTARQNRRAVVICR